MSIPVAYSRRIGSILLAGLSILSTLCWGTDQPNENPKAEFSQTPGLYVKVQLANPVKLSKLKPGDVVEGGLSRDVYSTDRKLFVAGSPVRLTVDHLEKRKRVPNDHWPGVIKLFTPRHENFPVFRTATVSHDGMDTALDVSLVTVSRMREVHAQAKKTKTGEAAAADSGAVEVGQSNGKKPATLTMVLEAKGLDTPAVPGANSNEAVEETGPAPETIPAGTRCKILLLGNVSASKSKPGDVVEARLLEPVLIDSKVVVPAGSMFEGKVLKKTPPRWLSRAGSLYMTFTGLTLPQGTQLPVTASLAGAELDRRSHTRMDSEGQFHGEHPGKAWMAINLGVTAGLAKEADDTFQIIFEAIVSTATDASTAGTARIISSCVSGIYMATRKGRDVVLPRFTEMDISLDRAVSLNPSASSGMAPGAAGK